MGRLAPACALIATLLCPRAAHATYSLLGADLERGLVGAAGASCVPYEVIRIYGVAPGHGAVVAQAYFDDPTLAEAVARLANGEDAASVLAAIADEATHPLAPRMQWAVVDVDGGVASATGPLAKPFADAIEGGAPGYSLSVQGNLLTSSKVLEHAVTGFEAESCDLAERLVRGLEAASEGGEGDGRCTPDGVPAKSAFVDVSDASGSLLRISIADVSPADPVPALREAFDAWRGEHACPKTTAAEPEEGAEPEEEGGSCAMTPRMPRDHVALTLMLVVALAALRRQPVVGTRRKPSLGASGRSGTNHG